MGTLRERDTVSNRKYTLSQFTSETLIQDSRQTKSGEGLDSNMKRIQSKRVGVELTDQLFKPN